MDASKQLETDEDSLKKGSATPAAIDQENAFEYGADFEELQKTEIQEVYSSSCSTGQGRQHDLLLDGRYWFPWSLYFVKVAGQRPDRKSDLFGASILRGEGPGQGAVLWSGASDMERGLGIKMASTYHTKSCHFISSTSMLETAHYRKLSVVLAQTGERGIPETHDLEGARQGLHSAYGQSKWVAEKLVMASNKNGLPATIIRPGYIVGHTRSGVTNTGDIIWRLIKDCVDIGSAPQMNAPVDFSPVDYVAHCVVSVATTPGTERDMVYQVTHSITTPFRFNEFFEAMDKYGYKVLTVEDKV
ncbi:unnamed protein product [Mortierella alpina]